MNKLYVCLTCWIFLFNGVCLYDKGDCNFPCMNSKYWTTTWFLVCLWRNLKYQFDSEEHVYFLGFVRGNVRLYCLQLWRTCYEERSLFYFHRNHHKSVSSNFVARNYSFKCFLDSFIWLNRQKGHWFRTFFPCQKSLACKRVVFGKNYSTFYKSVVKISIQSKFQKCLLVSSLDLN